MDYFRTDIPNIAAELFDGELVIANYDSGLYYSVAAGGALVWQGLRHGLSIESVVTWLSQRYTTEADLASRVRDFIDRMVEEGLLLATDASAAGPALPDLPDDIGALDFERFEDLQELLLLDPVHDVDQTGWPRRAEDDISG